MCTYSVISDYGRNRYPLDYWTPQTWPPFRDLLKQAEVVDKKTDQPDCEDPAKTAWIKDVEDRLRKLEQRDTVTSDKSYGG